MKEDKDDNVDSISTDSLNTKVRNDSKRNNICYHCLKDIEGNKTCSRCRTARYCDVSCQILDWPAHKNICIDSNNEDKVEKMKLKAENYAEQGNYHKAHQLSCKLYDMMKKKYGENHPVSVDAQYKLAITLGKIGKYQEAEKQYRRITEITGDNCNLNVMHATAGMCDMQGKKAEALELFKRCWEMRIKALGNDDYNTLLAMHSYGILLTDTSKHEEAEQILLECLKKQRQSSEKCSEMPQAILKSLISLANCYYAQENYCEAEKFTRQGVEESQLLLGKNHPEYFQHTSTLATILSDIGKLEEAEALQKDCVEKRKLILGDSHPQYFMALGNLGLIMDKGNRLDEAEAILKDCSKLERKILGETVHYLETMINLAGIYDRTDRRGLAQKIYKESFYKLKEIVGDNYRAVILARNKLMMSYEADGKQMERKEFFNDLGLKELTTDQTLAVAQIFFENATAEIIEDMMENRKTGKMSSALIKFLNQTATIHNQKKGL